MSMNVRSLNLRYVRWSSVTKIQRCVRQLFLSLLYASLRYAKK